MRVNLCRNLREQECFIFITYTKRHTTMYTAKTFIENDVHMYVCMQITFNIANANYGCQTFLKRSSLNGCRSYNGGRSNASSDKIFPTTGASLKP